MFVRLFLALLLLLSLGLTISTASSTLHLGMFAGAHLSVTRFHLILLMLAALTHHLLLMMLSIHLLLAMLIHLFIHGILPVTGAVMLDSLVVLPGLVFSNVLVVAVKVFSLVFIPGVVVLANFAMFSSPEAIVLFGGLTKAGDLILKPTREHMEANLIQVFQNKIKILVSHLRESDAAILGASALVWEGN